MPKAKAITIGSSWDEPQAEMAGAPAPFEGWLISITRDTLVMEDLFGAEHIKAVDKHARITLDGEMCEPQKLDPGARIRVTLSGREQRASVIDALGRQVRFAKTFRE